MCALVFELLHVRCDFLGFNFGREILAELEYSVLRDEKFFSRSLKI